MSLSSGKSKKKKSRMKSLPSVIDTTHLPDREEVKERETSKEKRSARSVASRSFRSAKEFIYNSGTPKSSSDTETNGMVIRSPRESSRTPRNRTVKGSMNSSRLKAGHKKTVSFKKINKDNENINVFLFLCM